MFLHTSSTYAICDKEDWQMYRKQPHQSHLCVMVLGLCDPWACMLANAIGPTSAKETVMEIYGRPFK